MKQYLDLLQRLKKDGLGTTDKFLYGQQVRLSLGNNRLPVCTTNKIEINSIVKTLLWFISGSSDNTVLSLQGVKTWESMSVKIGDIKTYAKQHSKGDANLEKTLINLWTNNNLNSVGDSYGVSWRNAPRKEITTLWPNVNKEDLPSDKLILWQKEYNEIKETSIDEIIDFDTFCKYRYHETVDQLNELIIGLKNNPFLNRHVVTSWIPSTTIFQSKSAQENVLLNRSSSIANEISFECFVQEQSEKPPVINMVLNISKLYVNSEATIVFTTYALLLALIAHSVKMQPGELICNIGETRLLHDDIKYVDIELCREPFDAPRISINPSKTDLFNFKFEDINIIEYQHHSSLDY